MKTLILIIAFFGFTSSALAMGRGSGPCEPAMDEFCGGLLEFSHDSVMNCLKKHENEVAPACKDLLKTWKPAEQDKQTNAASK